jgi:hypothetical protein
MLGYVKNNKWFITGMIMSAIIGVMAWHADHSMVNIKPEINMPE